MKRRRALATPFCICFDSISSRRCYPRLTECFIRLSARAARAINYTGSCKKSLLNKSSYQIRPFLRFISFSNTTKNRYSIKYGISKSVTTGDTFCQLILQILASPYSAFNLSARGAWARLSFGCGESIRQSSRPRRVLRALPLAPRPFRRQSFLRRSSDTARRL